MLKRINKVLAVIAIITLIASFVNIRNIENVKADTLEEQLRQLEQQQTEARSERDRIQREIDQNSYLISGYNAQASRLYGEIQIFQIDIDQLELQIKEVELSILSLNKKIEDTKIEIEKSKKDIQSLEKESNKRIKSNYMKYRIYGNEGGSGTSLFNVESINEYFKTVKYRDIIQEDTNDVMKELSYLRQELVLQEKSLNEDLARVEEEKKNIEAKKIELDKKQEELELQIAQYYAQINQINGQIAGAQATLAVFSQQEVDLARQAESIRQQLLNNFSPTYGGEYVVAGRLIGRQGCTGLCTGAHLHFSIQNNGAWQDPCAYLPSGFIAGCGGNGTVQAPIRGEFYYTSAFGNRCFLWGNSTYCDFHTGADFAGVPWNTGIYAAHDGYAYKGTDPYGANYVVICQNQNCNQGIKSGYWHLSSF